MKPSYSIQIIHIMSLLHNFYNLLHVWVVWMLVDTFHPRGLINNVPQQPTIINIQPTA